MRLLDIQKLQKYLIDDEIISEFISAFIEEIPKYLDEMEVVLNHDTFRPEELGKLAHKIKSSLAYTGASSLTKAAKNMEDLNYNNKAELFEIFTNFKQGCLELIQELKEYREDTL